MSLTSYQAAPPRVLCPDYAGSNRERNCKNCARRFTFAAKPNRIGSRESKSEIENLGRHGELVGSGVCRALVSEENAGGRPAGLVRAALRDGRSELDLLFGAGRAHGGALVPKHAGLISFST